MNDKQLRFLLVILIIVAGLLAIRISSPEISSPKPVYLEKIKDLKTTSIESIKIEKAGEKIEIKKENDFWKINGKKAEIEKTQALLSSLLPSAEPELVAQTDKRHKELELTEDMATKITLNNKLTIFSGKLGTYVRFNDSPAVYLLKNPLSISLIAADWYDKTIIALDETKTSRLSFSDGIRTTVLVKKDSKWSTESGNQEAKKEKIDTIFSTLSKLTALSLADRDSAKKYSPRPALTLISESDGQKETLEFFKGRDNYLVKRHSDGEYFTIAEYSISSLLTIHRELF